MQKAKDKTKKLTPTEHKELQTLASQIEAFKYQLGEAAFLRESAISNYKEKLAAFRKASEALKKKYNSLTEKYSAAGIDITSGVYEPRVEEKPNLILK